jgi:hypothetical protein
VPFHVKILIIAIQPEAMMIRTKHRQDETKSSQRMHLPPVLTISTHKHHKTYLYDGINTNKTKRNETTTSKKGKKKRLRYKRGFLVSGFYFPFLFHPIRLSLLY